MRKSSIVIFVWALLTLIGCGKAARMAVDRIEPNQYLTLAVTPAGYAGKTGIQRFIAVHHKLTVFVAENGLPKAWDSVIDYCGSIQCEVISSSIIAKSAESVPSGTISLRVSPDDLKKLLVYLEKQGRIGQHATETADKTGDVLDTDARLKNLTTFRDSLRGMLVRPSVGVKDFVEIQEKLTDVQSELDSETAKRQVLANETEKVAVEIAFYEGRSAQRGGVFKPIGDAFRESGSVLAESVASLITVVVSVVPWLVLIVPGCWAFVKLWRKLRRRRSGSTPSTSTAT